MTETADTTATRQALDRQAASPKEENLREFLDRLAPKLEPTLPAQIGVERFTRLVLNEAYRVPELLDCSPRSFVGACLYSAQLGLEPGPLGHVYFVPFKNKAGGKDVTWILGYRGMIELAYRSGQLKRIEAHVVKTEDEFDYRFGTRAFLDFTPSPEDRSAMAWLSVYALAELRTGGKVFVVLHSEDVEARRKRSPAGRSNKGPWATDTEAMWRKSAIRALQPLLPQTPGFAEAVTRDETAAPEVDEISAELELRPVSDSDGTEDDAAA